MARDVTGRWVAPPTSRGQAKAALEAAAARLAVAAGFSARGRPVAPVPLTPAALRTLTEQLLRVHRFVVEAAAELDQTNSSLILRLGRSAEHLFAAAYQCAARPDVFVWRAPDYTARRAADVLNELGGFEINLEVALAGLTRAPLLGEPYRSITKALGILLDERASPLARQLLLSAFDSTRSSYPVADAARDARTLYDALRRCARTGDPEARR